MSTPAGVRVCFVGDSLVAGIGDEHALGWPGRLAAREASAGFALTAYNLGIRRDTSSNVLARCRSEIDRRFSPGSQSRLVLSFGVNDSMFEAGEPRVNPSTSRANLIRLLETTADVQALFVGPSPVLDDRHNDRIAALSEAFRHICSDFGRPFVDVFPALVTDAVWRQQVRDGDGAHPGAAGYTTLFNAILPAWDTWLQAPPDDAKTA